MLGLPVVQGSLAYPVPAPGTTARVVGLGFLAAAIALRPLVPDGGAGLLLEALILCCAAAALALHWIGAAHGAKPTWRRPTLGIAAAVTALVGLAVAAVAPDAWPAGLVVAGRLACLVAFAAALQQGDESSGGALVRGVAAAAVVAAAVGVIDGLRPALAEALGVDAIVAPPGRDEPSLLDWPALRAPAELPRIDERGTPHHLARPALTGGRLAAVGVAGLPVVCALFLLVMYDERGRTGSALRTGVTATAIVVLTATVGWAGGWLGFAALGVALAAFLLAAWRHLPMAEGRPRFLWLALPLGLGVGLATGLPRGPLPSPAAVSVPSVLTTQRPAWSRAAAHVAARPLAGVGPGGYAAADVRRTPAGQTPAAGAGSSPVTLAVESGLPFTVCWLGVLLAAFGCVRVSVAAPPADAAAPPPRPPVRATAAAMAVALGGALVLLVPLLSTGPFDLPTGAAVLFLWGGLAGAFACPERPGVRPLPPLLRAGALGGCVGAFALGCVSDVLAHPSVALGLFVLAGVAATTAWAPPADERPERPPRALARVAAWAAPVMVALAAAILLPLGGYADHAIADARAGSVARRLAGAGLTLAGSGAEGRTAGLGAGLRTLPGAGHSASLLALRGRALTSTYFDLIDSPPTAARARSLKPLLDEGLKALGRAQIAWPEQPGPVVMSARVALAVVADVEAVQAGDPAAAADPELRAWRSRLVSNALRDARQAVQLLPGRARPQLILAEALLAEGEAGAAAQALAAAETLARAAPAGQAPDPAAFAALRGRITAAADG